MVTTNSQQRFSADLLSDGQIVKNSTHWCLFVDISVASNVSSHLLADSDFIASCDHALVSSQTTCGAMLWGQAVEPGCGAMLVFPIIPLSITEWDWRYITVHALASISHSWDSLHPVLRRDPGQTPVTTPVIKSWWYNLSQHISTVKEETFDRGLTSSSPQEAAALWEMCTSFADTRAQRAPLAPGDPGSNLP